MMEFIYSLLSEITRLSKFSKIWSYVVNMEPGKS